MRFVFGTHYYGDNRNHRKTLLCDLSVVIKRVAPPHKKVVARGVVTLH